MSINTGVVHGRFQILTMKQMEYILAAKMRCNKLYLGITHPDIVNFAATSTLDTSGISKKDNPMTFFERYQMLLNVFEEFKIKRDDFEIIPFPISHPDILLGYIPTYATYYMNIITPWDKERLRTLELLGLKTEIIWEREIDEIGVTANDIRLMIQKGDQNWQMHVPKSVRDYIVSHKIDTRIQQLYS
jgi:nicotinamide mononucleotide adenylyltransferase